MGNMEIRLHGKGGQGAVSAIDMLVAAFASEGKHASGFPFFGSERRGAPTTAFVRFGDKPIREKTKIYFPDCLIVFDSSQLNLPMVYAGLKPQGILVANTTQYLKRKPDENVKVIGIVNATRVALEELGMTAVSTCMIGAFAATTNWVKLDSILSILPDYFKGKLLEKNMRCIERGFKETRVME
jgi:2-oxoacid:acceptor oxidoreductase gamma subunit (pyruvate/2-ketoisovalerate family)